jgi:predicted metalloenzyme YecM
MNYQLTISLDGDEQVNSQLDKLMSNVEKLSSGKAGISNLIKLDDIKKIDSVLEKIGMDGGEKMGEAISKGVKKKFRDKPALFDAKILQGGLKFPEVPQWLKNITQGIENDVSSNSGLAQFIKQRHEPSGKEVDTEFWLQKFPPLITKGLRDVTGDDLAKVIGMGEFNPLEKIKGLRDVTGADLAKVQGLGDITQFDSKQNWKKMMVGLVTGLTGNQFIGSRVLSDELGKGSGGGMAGGLFGKAGAIGFSEIYIGFKIFDYAVKTFQHVVETSLANAQKIYSSALQNGLGLSFSAKRGALANILGVSEQDVFKFGAQMAYLNPLIKDATDILAKTSKPLTQLKWNFDVLKLDASALAAQITNDLAPAINTFALTLDGLLKVLNRYKDIGDMIQMSNPFVGGSILIGKLWEKIIHKINPATDPSKMPNPQAWMKQLPASHWEHMGLVIGGGAQNYQRDIARNTKDTAAGIKAIVAKMKGSGNADFGFSALVNNP